MASTGVSVREGGRRSASTSPRSITVLRDVAEALSRSVKRITVSRATAMRCTMDSSRRRSRASITTFSRPLSVSTSSRTRPEAWARIDATEAMPSASPRRCFSISVSSSVSASRR